MKTIRQQPNEQVQPEMTHMQDSRPPAAAGQQSDIANSTQGDIGVATTGVLDAIKKDLTPEALEQFDLGGSVSGMCCVQYATHEWGQADCKGQATVIERLLKQRVVVQHGRCGHCACLIIIGQIAAWSKQSTHVYCPKSTHRNKTH
eukprot:GHUV01042488.1.p1 GENE.GHUV01042488.1~~GHUV01042488.1.p1  ORF type:complete len:146 (+),score=29.48 GHUV01042488.1:702-1139(+)